MKRVLLTTHKFFPEHRAGTEVLTLKAALELKARGYQVIILTANPPDLDSRRQSNPTNNEELVMYEYEGLSVYCLTEEARLKNNGFSNEYYNAYLKKHFKKIFDQLVPDLVHCFHLQNLSASLIEEVQARKIPIVYSATDFWLICPVVQLRRPDGTNCSGPAPLGVNCLSCFTPKTLPDRNEFEEAVKNKYAANWQKLQNIPQSIADITKKAAYLAYMSRKFPESAVATMERTNTLKFYANLMSAITVPTQLMKNLFIKNGLNEKIIHNVPYGIDTKPLERGIQKVESNDLRFAFIGALAEHKGPDLLIKAFLQLPADSRANLVLYGDLNQFPQYGKYLQALLKSDSPLARKINFAGTFANDRIGEIFQSIDVLIVPSRWYENTPLVIQSSLAAQTPVIAANLGGMSEIIKDRQNGLLFEANNEQSLQNQLLSLLNNAQLLGQLRSNIKPERTIVEMVDAFELIYEKISK